MGWPDFILLHIQQFTRHMSMSDEYEHSSSKNRCPSNIPPKQNGNFLQKKFILFKCRYFTESTYLSKTAQPVFRKVTAGALGVQMATQCAHVLACIFTNHVYRIRRFRLQGQSVGRTKCCWPPPAQSDNSYVFCNEAASSTNGRV